MSGLTHESPLNQSIEWYTPPEVFAALGLTFDLDPASPGEGRDFVPARRRYTAGDNGLLLPWEGLVWLNPPYGRETPLWLERLAEHGNGIALVFARTDTDWFHKHASRADVICFIKQRIRFYQGDRTTKGGSPGAGSMLLGYGPVAAAAVRASGLGLCR